VLKSLKDNLRQRLQDTVPDFSGGAWGSNADFLLYIEQLKFVLPASSGMGQYQGVAELSGIVVLQLFQDTPGQHDITPFLVDVLTSPVQVMPQSQLDYTLHLELIEQRDVGSDLVMATELRFKLDGALMRKVDVV